MSKKASYILGILLTIILGTILYYYLCCNCFGNVDNEYKETEIKQEVVVPEVNEVTKNAFAITDNESNFKIRTNDNFNFKISDFSILNPISEKVPSETKLLKEFLLTNPLKTIDITGYYKSDELNNSAYPNLGLARANAVKNYFVSQDISSKQIDTKGQLNDDIYPDDSSILYGPVSFGILTADKSDTSAIDALKSACDSLRANPIVLYFKTGEASINLSPQQRQKIADISHCVDKLDVKVQVVGHTDNTGVASNNVILGQQRADFAKRYLIKNGILEQNIQATSKGQTEPIAANNTEEGKTKNRRTVVTIN
ncbi:OmpA family protein [uncultured Algibacter sp.]|uniref:OmpA family protein n=1 Tax=uncultured Algibacter sp. TaxID=298659 RepID=UPI003216F17E